MASNALLAKLNAARERLARAEALVKDSGRGESWAELSAAQADTCDLEREVALADGLECAERCDAIPLWNVDAPCPTVLRAGGRVTLLYLARTDPDPNWDGASARVVRSGDTLPDMLAPQHGGDDVRPRSVVVLRFDRPRAVRTGTPNDEVLHAHPLSGAGLAPHRPHAVINSSWVKALRTLNAEHSQYAAKSWDAVTHYLLTFKDETFECVADGVVAEVRTGSLAELARSELEMLLASR